MLVVGHTCALVRLRGGRLGVYDLATASCQPSRCGSAVTGTLDAAWRGWRAWFGASALRAASLVVVPHDPFGLRIERLLHGVVDGWGSGGPEAV